ncbi:MAG: sortase [Patescibacteria group bacterium]|nr:sortase [Patescibacteria group bacterium]
MALSKPMNDSTHNHNSDGNSFKQPGASFNTQTPLTYAYLTHSTHKPIDPIKYVAGAKKIDAHDKWSPTTIRFTNSKKDTSGKSIESQTQESSDKQVNQNTVRKALIMRFINTYSLLGVFLWILASGAVLIPEIPYIWYMFNSHATSSEIQSITETEISQEVIVDNTSEEPIQDNILPPFDKSLPYENILIINKVGIYGEIHQDINAYVGLEKGIWIANDFGNPEDNNPIILAAHRFGYLRWSKDFRDTNTFYNLPKTDVGDTLEIIWNKRRYEYKIYRAEDNTQVADYNADLILYTCRLFDSPIRIFRYARRVN